MWLLTIVRQVQHIQIYTSIFLFEKNISKTYSFLGTIDTMKIALTITLLLKAAGLVAAGVAAPFSEELSEDSISNTTESSIEESTIERRAYGHGSGRVICGRFANADGNMALDLIRSLENKDKDRTWDVGPGACNRVTCWDTSAIYVCNVSLSPNSQSQASPGQATK